MPTILIVDDAPDNVAILSAVLKDEYRTKGAITGENALELVLHGDVPDLILLDVMMPGMDGYEVCRRLKLEPKTADIPVIFLTSMTDPQDEQRGLALGAVDYITKPPSLPIVLARIRTHLHLKGVRDFLLDKSEYLEKEVVRRTHEIGVIQDATMIALGSLAETRDNETGNHIRRTQNYLRALATQLKSSLDFEEYLSDDTIELLYKSAPLHDIGKVGIPDHILLKPSKLDSAEFEIMKTHTTLGRNAIVEAEKRLDSPNSFLRTAREIAWAHHEKWDGSGYPRGLAGEAIPIAARLMAIPDVYDALISVRVYKPAFSHEMAVSSIGEGSGSQFDPEIVQAFLDISPLFHKIAQEYGDHGSRDES